MTVFIHDASILLDLIHTDLLQLFLAIPVRMVTTDFVVGEISVDADKEQLEAAASSGALQVLISGMAELESIAALQSAHRALSIADCSVLFYANRPQAVVLTGDSRLRREATDAGLDVHGTGAACRKPGAADSAGESLDIVRRWLFQPVMGAAAHAAASPTTVAWRDFCNKL